MKKVLFYLGVYFSSIFLLYLSGVVISLDFDFRNWYWLGRFMVVFWALIIADGLCIERDDF